MEFNFSGLHSVFLEAIKRHEPSIVFPLTDGKGRFVFMLFIPTDSKGEIKWGSFELFIVLGRTQTILSKKLLGNHYNKGDFKVRFDNADEQVIRKELGIDGSSEGRLFAFKDFLDSLNSLIPASISLQSKIETLQQNRDMASIHCSKYLEDASKIYLLGKKELTGCRPREETLRKLYMLNGDPAAIAKLITHLKQRNWTVCWTDKKPDGDAFSAVWQKVMRCDDE